MVDDTKIDNTSQNAKAATPAPAASSADAVRNAEIKAQEAAREAAEAKMTPEERKAVETRQKADDARAKAAQEDAEAKTLPDAMTVAEARMLVPASGELGAGDHMAQKFGNYPENPKSFKGDHDDPEKMTVKLYMTVPDHPAGARTTMVHPEMVGDYLRAGWSETAPVTALA